MRTSPFVIACALAEDGDARPATVLALSEEEQRTRYDRIALLDRRARAMYERPPGRDVSIFEALEDVEVDAAGPAGVEDLRRRAAEAKALLDGASWSGWRSGARCDHYSRSCSTLRASEKVRFISVNMLILRNIFEMAKADFEGDLTKQVSFLCCSIIVFMEVALGVHERTELQGCVRVHRTCSAT